MWVFSLILAGGGGGGGRGLVFRVWSEEGVQLFSKKQLQ